MLKCENEGMENRKNGMKGRRGDLETAREIRMEREIMENECMSSVMSELIWNHEVVIRM